MNEKLYYIVYCIIVKKMVISGQTLYSFSALFEGWKQHQKLNDIKQQQKLKVIQHYIVQCNNI